MMRKSLWLIFLPLSLALILLVNRASLASNAAPVDQGMMMPGPTTLIRLDPQVRQRYVAPPAVFLRSMVEPERVTSASIVVNYTGSDWTADAINAFQYAVDIWETLITSSVPIEVNAQFGPLPPGVLGGAGPTQIRRDFSNAPQANTWYPVATANKLANGDLDPTEADIQATFSSTFGDWYFGTGSSTPSDKINFTTVVLHELGHGLGFTGSMRVDNGSGTIECRGFADEGCYGYNGYPMIYDRFTENGSGNALLSYSNYSGALASQLTSDNIYFDSPGARFANGGGRAPLYAPGTWRQGSSYSHLSDSYNGTPNALMTYSVARGETLHNPGPVALCMFDDMGWTVAETCRVTAISGLAAENDGPTVLGNSTRLTATISAGSDVTYEWDFGDDNNGSGKVVQHQYAAPGSYTATVVATNSISQKTATTVVHVDTLIGSLTADNDGPAVLGETVQLTSAVSSGSRVNYVWDFGDGNSGSGSDVSYLYTSPGPHIAEVTAYNSVSEKTATTVVHVDTIIGGLVASNDGPKLYNAFTNFTAAVSSGSNVTYEWDFGDGHSGTGKETSHRYAAPITYTAVVTAANLVSQATATTVVETKVPSSIWFAPLVTKP